MDVESGPAFGRGARVPLALALLAAAAVAVPADAQNERQAGRSQAGMVSTAHPLATEAGVRILELGGNAADAAVAAGFAIAVVEPTMNSIGGRNQILVRRPDGSFHGIDGTTQAPWDYDPDTAPQADHGYAVIGIPGALDGLIKLHTDHGSLPLETVVAPAVDYAANGYRILPADAARLASGADDALAFPGTAAIYYRPDGAPYRAGDLLRQPDYARTLRSIAKGGRAVFYEGSIAEAMAADFAANGSVVTLEAISSYRAEDARIVRGSYRGHDLVGMDIPAAGALTIQALHILENFEPSDMSEAEWFALVGQAVAIARTELAVLGTDSAAARATSKEWAARRAAELSTPAVAGATRRAPVPWPAADDQGHTTHLSVADAEGMSVSLTQTLGPNMGSKVVTPGLGFLYASTLGGYLSSIEAGVRARSNISPFMVARDGDVVLVLGAAGGGMIPPAVVHAVTRVIDFGMTLPEALEAPRVAFGGGGYTAETSPDIGWTPIELAEMRSLGLEIVEVPRSGAFGRVHGIQYDPATRTWTGAADPDWEGSARGPAARRR